MPFEKAYDLHQVIGAITFGLSLAHGTAHVTNLSIWTGWSFQVTNFAKFTSCDLGLSSYPLYLNGWYKRKQGSLWCGAEQDGFLFCSAISGIVLQVYVFWQ